jgi:hypothetical protein
MLPVFCCVAWQTIWALRRLFEPRDLNPASIFDIYYSIRVDSGRIIKFFGGIYVAIWEKHQATR